MPALRIAYLISRYPAISHTFILREVVGLRKLGLEIQAASINRPDRATAELTEAERSEEAACFYVKHAAKQRLTRDLPVMLISRPWAFARAVAFALSANRADLVKAAMNLAYLAEAVIVAEWMRGLKLNHLHVHFATPAATVGLLVTKLMPVSLSITVHGPDEFYDTSAYLLAEKCTGARFLCAISDFAASQLKKVMPVEEWPKVKVAPLGVDLELFAPSMEQRAEQHALSGHSFQLICVGRLVAAKGQHVLIEALEMLRAQGREVQLTLVGDGPDRRSLEQAARDRGMASSVKLTGAMNQDHIRALYGAADVFVLASFAEGVPVVLMEAMAMELPCITTWVAGIPELIRDGIDGLLVPPANPGALAQAIESLIDDGELRLRLGRAGRLRIGQKYDLSRSVARLGRIFAEGVGQAA